MNEYWKFLKQLLPFIGVGVVVCAIAVIAILFMQRGAHMDLEGSIQKVRTLPMDEQSSVAIIDFRLRNPSDYPFIVRKAEVSAVGPNGAPIEASVVSEVDAKKIFQYFTQLGPKYNETLLMNTRINPKQSVDRMLAARFEVPEKVLQSRQNLRIHIDEIDGPAAELKEKQK